MCDENRSCRSCGDDRAIAKICCLDLLEIYTPRHNVIMASQCMSICESACEYFSMTIIGCGSVNPFWEALAQESAHTGTHYDSSLCRGWYSCGHSDDSCCNSWHGREMIPLSVPEILKRTDCVDPTIDQVQWDYLWTDFLVRSFYGWYRGHVDNDQPSIPIHCLPCHRCARHWGRIA